VKSTLMGTSKVAEIRETEWDLTTRTDSIAGFFDDALIFDPAARTSTSTLYEAYREYCKESGLSAKSIHKFTPDLIELCSIKLGLAVSGHRSNKGRSIIGLRFRSESDGYVGSDASILEPVTVSNPVPVSEVTVMTLSSSNSEKCGTLRVSPSRAPFQESQNRIEREEKKQMDVFETPQMMEELKAESKASGTNSTNSSNTDLENYTPPVTKQHSIAQPSPSDEEILPKGTKVHCERLDKDGVVYSSRRKEFKKPNGTTEIVLQYYVDFGGEVYKWFDWDLLVALA
jgi:hypothetical protein